MRFLPSEFQRSLTRLSHGLAANSVRHKPRMASIPSSSRYAIGALKRWTWKNEIDERLDSESHCEIKGPAATCVVVIRGPTKSVVPAQLSNGVASVLGSTFKVASWPYMANSITMESCWIEMATLQGMRQLASR